MEEGKLPRSQESRVGKDSLSGSKPRISRAYLSVDLGTQSYLSAAGRPAIPRGLSLLNFLMVLR